MALVNISPFQYPDPITGLGTIGTTILTDIAMDAATDRVAVSFQCPKAGDLDRVEFFISAGSDITNVLRVGWQGYDLATGQPDGTFTHYADISGYSAGSWIIPAYFGSTGGGSGTRKTVTADEYVSFVISGEAEGTWTLTTSIQAVDMGVGAAEIFPQSSTNLTGAYANNLDCVVIALYYSGDSTPVYLGERFYPIKTEASLNISTSNPDIGGAVFTIPFKCRVRGCWFLCDTDADLTLRLLASPFNSTSDLLGGITIDKDVAGATGYNFYKHVFSSAITLEANTQYRLVLCATTTTNSTLKYITVDDNNSIGEMFGGVNFYMTQSDVAYASLTGSTDFTDTNTAVPMIGLIIDQIDNGTSASGGLKQHPGMTGGING